MQGILANIFGGRLRNVLMVFFSLIAAITIGLGAIATSRTITDYLAQAADERIARDLDLALAFYNVRQDRVARVSKRLAISPPLKALLSSAKQGDERAIAAIREEAYNETQVPTISGNQLILILDDQGNTVVGYLLCCDGKVELVSQGYDWSPLPIVATALREQRTVVATEVIPVEFLASVGLEHLARVDLVDTPKAAPALYDDREGTAGLTLAGVTPVFSDSGEIHGLVVAVHLFNNDFTLVDQIKQVAGVDTATIFFGDLRISTNVLDEQGRRAIGTRISQEVGDQVLFQNLQYSGRAYVVKEWFITRYVPLHDHLGHVVGSLYVGAREAAFQALVQTFVARITYITLGAVCLAALISLPISIAVARPITELVEAHRLLAAGEMGVRVEPMHGKGELPALSHSFNAMAETLQTTQEQLLQKEKLASMGQLAAGVAHEINNPLGTILLLADVMCKDTPQGSTQYEDLKMITEQARRCKGIVFDLLSFARQNRVVAQKTDVNQLIESIVSEESLKDSYKGIEIVHDLDARLPIIEADPDQLRQVFVNLMDNAADAMSEQGGMLTICTRSLGRQQVEVSVSDTGMGMSEETIAQLFTPFFTTKSPGKGTGLGLSIIYGIVKMHRGDIRVNSQEGKGATFTVTLPVHLPDLGRASQEELVEQGESQ